MDKREQKYQEQLTRILETIRRNYELDNFNFVFEHSWKKLKCLVEQHMRVEMLAEIDRINSEMKSAESLFALQRNRSELDNIISYYDYSFAKLSKTNLHIK